MILLYGGLVHSTCVLFLEWCLLNMALILTVSLDLVCVLLVYILSMPKELRFAILHHVVIHLLMVLYFHILAIASIKHKCIF